MADSPFASDPATLELMRSPQLIAEVVRAKARPQAALEEAQTANEELQAANEELASQQEELRVTNASLLAKSAELEALSNDLTSLLASTHIAVIFLDPDHRVRRYTPAVKDLIDLLPTDLGRPLTNLRWQFDDSHLLADAKAVYHHLAPVEREVTAEGGRTYLRRVHPHRTRDDRIDGVVVAFLDVTVAKRMEEQLRQAQRMEAIGQLAGGIAHDFNNLLQVINGYAQILLDEEGDEVDTGEILQQIREAGERAATLTRQLLAYSRKQVLQPREVDLGETVRNIERLLRRLIGEDVALTCDTAGDLWRVRVDPGQIEQVILNLAVNARDAMPRGGRLTIATTNAELGEGDTSDPPAWPGRYALLAVTDTGTGMTPEVKARVFEPFFTTKEVGKGTGLGLATVYGIVRQSGGHITVDSEPGRGATFRIYLPAVEGGRPAGKSPGLGSNVPKGTETILLAEDEESVRRLVRRVLEGVGYTVLEAGDGVEAVRVAEQHAGPIHLLVSDVVMPVMGGRLLAERLSTVRPGIRVLFLSGHTDDAVMRHGVELGTPFLQKPSPPATLAHKVREVLDGRPSCSGA